MTTRTRTSLAALVISILLALPAVPAAANDSGPAARATLGTSLTIGGIVMIPITAELILAGEHGAGAGYTGLMAPLLMCTGIPTLVEGIVQAASGHGTFSDPVQRAAWGRARMGDLAIVYVLAGSMFGGFSLTGSAVLWANHEYAGPPTFILPFAGLGLMGAGIGFAADASAAAGTFPGEVEDVDDPPGEVLAKNGVALMAVGTGFLVGVAPAVRIASSETSFSPMVVLTPILLGAGYAAGGAVMLITGVQRWSVGWGQARRPGAPRARIVGVTPTYDPYTRSAGVSLVGITW